MARLRSHPAVGFALLVLAVVVVDQLSKASVRQLVAPGAHVLAWPLDERPFFSITHEVNSGVAFGLFKGRNPLLLALAISIAVGLTVAQFRLGAAEVWLRTAFGLQVGGALGNVLDRVQLGHVTDFIQVGRWPVFNVADSAVSLGTAMLLWHLVRHVDEGSGKAGVAPEPSD